MNDAEAGKLILYKYQGYPLGSVFLSYETEERLPIMREAEDRAGESGTLKNLVVIDGFLVIALVLLAAGFTALMFFLRKRFRPKNTFRW